MLKTANHLCINLYDSSNSIEYRLINDITYIVNNFDQRSLCNRQLFRSIERSYCNIHDMFSSHTTALHAAVPSAKMKSCFESYLPLLLINTFSTASIDCTFPVTEIY